MNELNDADLDLLDQFVQNTLNSGQKAHVEELMRSNDAWREAYALRVQVKQAARKRFHQRMRHHFSKIDKSGSGGKRFWRKRLLQIAAIVILVALIWVLLKPREKAPELMAYYEPLPNLVFPIEKSAADYSDREKAYQAYELKQYPLAVQRFESLKDLGTADRLYLAISHMESGTLEKAAELFDEVSKSKDKRWADAAEFYTLWLLVKQGRKEDALELLKRIEGTAGHTYQHRARELRMRTG